MNDGTHYQHNDDPTDADPIRPGRYCGPHCDLYEPAEPEPEPEPPAGDGGGSDESPNYARAQRVNRNVPGWRSRL